MRKKIGKIGGLIVVGMLVLVGLSAIVAAQAYWDLQGNPADEGDFLGTTTYTDLVFKTDSTERMRITGDTGDVGIGTDLPVARLDVNNDAQNALVAKFTAGSYVQCSDIVWIGSQASSSSYNLFKIDYGSDYGTNALTVRGDGNVGIGTDSPGAKLDVCGSAQILRQSNGCIGIFGRSDSAIGKLHFGISPGGATYWAPYDDDQWQWNRECGYNPADNAWYFDNALEIGGQIKIAGGSPGAGKVLTSDPNGLASWQTFSGDNDWAWSSGSGLTGNIYRTGKVNIKQMATPTGVSAQEVDGGSLTADTTYYYKVTAVDAGGGETTGSTEVSATTTSTKKSIQISWSASTGAIYYKVYGRASGAQNLFWTVYSTSFTDVGTGGSSGSVPGSNTAWITGISSSGTSWVSGGNFRIRDWLEVGNSVGSGSGGIIFKNNAVMKTAFDGMRIYINTDNDFANAGSFSIHRTSSEERVRFDFYNSGDPDSWILPGGDFGIGTNTPSASLHVDQSSSTGAKPVLTVDQADVSEEFIRFIGTSANGVVTQSLVEDADVTTRTLEGWLKIYVYDGPSGTGQLGSQAYYVPIYTLT